MSNLSKTRQSRNSWTIKAIERGASLRDAKKRQKRSQSKIQRLEQALLNSELAKKNLNDELQMAKTALSSGSQPIVEIRVICVLLVINAVVSFRSIPRILNSLCALGTNVFAWIPHFSSVINWNLRVGVFLLEQVKQSTERWIAIMDCSIDIGTRKALVVLRVPLDVLLKTGKALTLKDCECIGVKISSTWNGQTVAAALTEIFAIAGAPVAILKDGGSDLKRGVNNWRMATGNMGVFVLGDIGHIVGNALKAMFSKCPMFKNFITIISNGAARIRQTDLSFFLPPKIRSKGRFQSIGRVAKWSQTVIGLLGGHATSCESAVVSRLRDAFKELPNLQFFLSGFILACQVADEFSKLMKNEGVNQKSYREAKIILEKLPKESILRKALDAWLERHITIQCRLSIGQTPLCVSSDIIESLFGKFKGFIQRCQKAELNKIALAIPTMCGHVDEKIIQQALATTSHISMTEWVKKNIPTTLRAKKMQHAREVRTNNNGGPIYGKVA